jgi:hypothetical protein
MYMFGQYYSSPYVYVCHIYEYVRSIYKMNENIQRVYDIYTLNINDLYMVNKVNVYVYS